MGDDDRPFACSEPGCNMKFANEDHLTVHRMKHQMSLTLTPGTGKFFSFSLADQTPTPTKFLKNCDEIGLFNELTVAKNPFDDAFKQAAEGKKTLTLPIASSTSDNDVLNTPQPKFVLQQEGCPSPVVSTAPPLASKSPEVIIMEPQIAAPLPGPPEEDKDDFDESGACIMVTDSPLPGPLRDMGSTVTPTAAGDDEPTAKRRRTHLDSGASGGPVEVVVEEHYEEYVEGEPGAGGDAGSIMLNSGGVAIAPSLPQSSSHTPVLSPAPALSIATSPEASALGGGVQQQATIAPNVIGLTKALSGSGGAPQYVIQVMVQTPSGETLPVHIPAAIPQILNNSSSGGGGGGAGGGGLQVPRVTTVPIGGVRQTSSSQVSSTTGAGGVTTASSLTKRKLKETLQQNIQQNIFTSNMRVMTEAVDRVTATQQNTKGRIGKGVSILNPAVMPKVEVIDADTSSNSSARSQTDDDGDDRRQKFLERNRAAAARCRQKKKQWVGNLEQKADDLENTNAKLKGEVSALKAEVTNLKVLLLAHKDCPVTRQQHLNGQLTMVVADDRPFAQVVQSSSAATTSSPTTSAVITSYPAIATKIEPHQDVKPIIINVSGGLPASLEPINLKIAPNT